MLAAATEAGPLAQFECGQVVYDCGSYERVIARTFTAGQWWYKFEGDGESWTPEGMLRCLSTEEMFGC